MPEDPVTTTRESQVASGFDQGPADTADSSGEFNVWFLLLMVLVVGLVAVQNLWLRRRAEREAKSDDDL
jgi:hypothetical protein